MARLFLTVCRIRPFRGDIQICLLLMPDLEGIDGPRALTKNALFFSFFFFFVEVVR